MKVTSVEKGITTMIQLSYGGNFFVIGVMMKNKIIVRICEDHIIRDQEEVQKILKRVSDIISKSYIRQMNEQRESLKVVVI